MKHFMTLMALVVAVTAGAQQNPSYDPDWNGDGRQACLDVLKEYFAEDNLDLVK